ncbi:unnamed protein product [Nezara viridula]|uniref:SCP domain-containing protein n=1 Tax=Nezara viridula TaxID=85310 RepID=A0A9P0HU60_NEZVI|nr:unnamed protein product [Nezara viridula]
MSDTHDVSGAQRKNDFFAITNRKCMPHIGAEEEGSGGLSCYEKDCIVRWHNERRSGVALGLVKTQPPAQNMMEICWDDELERQAQRWADNCLYEHDKRRTHCMFNFFL